MSAPAINTVVRGAGALVPAVQEALAAVHPAAPAACIIPAVPASGSLAELTDERLAEVGDALDAVLAEVQHVLQLLRGNGRLVFVLPYAPLMATPGGAAASAVTNGVLSLARTLAIELARDSVTVNVLAVDAVAPAVPALRAQLAALLGEGGGAVTGQEVYLTGGTDLGRLRP
jgi:NAD(P)-dependent dehydrogenase (short-subunit alcohol dehydrogenase family)